MDKGGRILADEGSFEVEPTPQQAERLKAYVGREVFFGIRPEDMQYTKEPAQSNNMQMKVSIIEPLGAETHLYLATRSQQVIARTEPDNTFRIGDTANFVPNMEKGKFFDKESEANICEDVRSE